MGKSVVVSFACPAAALLAVATVETDEDDMVYVPEARLTRTLMTAAPALLFAFAVGAASATLSAQGRMITLTPSTVEQGQSVRVQSPACGSGTTIVLIGDNIFPAKAEGEDFVLQTDSLAPGTYAMTTKCGDAVSIPASLIVAAKRSTATPIVVCARNASARDGVATALTQAAADAEEKRITAAKAVVAQGVRWPTPDETTLLLGRCHKDWAWTVRLEDRLQLDVQGYYDWVQVEANKQRPPRLYLDGVELPHITVSYVSRDPMTNLDRLEAVVTFENSAGTPEAREASRKALAQVLRTARARNWNFGASDMPVSLGQAGGPHWATNATIRVNPYPKGLTIAAALAVLVLLVALVRLAHRTPLLRDGGMTTPFSLAKNQMAMWFFIIFTAFLFVTVTTGQSAALSTTALALIGLSGATGLAAAAIDNRKRSVDENERRTLEGEVVALTRERDELKAKLDAVTDKSSADAVQLNAAIEAKTKRLEVVNLTLREKPAPAPLPTQGWLTDILSDEHGLSFHRLQMAAWTVGLVGVFVVAVWRTFAMPEFDATMLGLLGISAGTYLGFKFPERATSANTPGN